MSNPPNPRTVSPKQPLGLIVGAVLVAAAVLAVIIYGTYSLSSQNANAWKRGTIVKKEFIAAPEEQVTIGKQGLNATEKAGEYILTVEVPQEGKESKQYHVWLDKARYDAVKVGDSFDVGPYLLPGGS